MKPHRFSEPQLRVLRDLAEADGPRYVRPATATVLRPGGLIQIFDERLSIYTITVAGRAAAKAKQWPQDLKKGDRVRCIATNAGGDVLDGHHGEVLRVVPLPDRVDCLVALEQPGEWVTEQWRSAHELVLAPRSAP